jgi:hypothetical protein
MKTAKKTSLATMSLASNELFASAFLMPPRSTGAVEPGLLQPLVDHLGDEAWRRRSRRPGSAGSPAASGERS